MMGSQVSVKIREPTCGIARFIQSPYPFMRESGMGLYTSMAPPSNCFKACTYSVSAWRPASVMR